MEKNSNKTPRIFFGWWTVFITGLLSGYGASFYMYGISVFFKDLAFELGISRAVTSIAAGIGRLEGGFTSPIVGWLSDRYGSRWIIFTGAFIVGSGMVIMYFIQSVWAYIVVWGVLIGIGHNIGFTVSVDKCINDWFTNKLGIAQGTKFALIGVMGMILLPILAWLTANMGWRITCLLCGIVMLASTPLILIFVRQNRPEFYGLLPDGKKNDHHGKTKLIEKGETNEKSASREDGFSLKQALKTRSYWFVSFALTAQAIVSGTVNVHFIPFLTDIGIDRTVAGGMLGMMIFFTIPARFFGGILADRIKKEHLRFLLAGVLTMLTIAVLMFSIFQSIIMIYIILAIYGFSCGVPTPLLVIINSRYFGRKSFGSILGTAALIRSPFVLLSPVFAGWIYDRTGEYIIAFRILAVILIFGIALLCLADPPALEKE